MTVLASKFGQMVHDMMVNGRMAELMARVNLSIQTATYMKENGLTIKLTVKESIFT